MFNWLCYGMLNEIIKKKNWLWDVLKNSIVHPLDIMHTRINYKFFSYEK